MFLHSSRALFFRQIQTYKTLALFFNLYSNASMRDILYKSKDCLCRWNGTFYSCPSINITYLKPFVFCYFIFCHTQLAHESEQRFYDVFLNDLTFDFWHCFQLFPYNVVLTSCAGWVLKNTNVRSRRETKFLWRLPKRQNILYGRRFKVLIMT